MPVVSDESPFNLTSKGVTVDVRLQPGASRNQIDGTARLDDGMAVLRARVSAPPEKGKANEALARLLAKAWKLPKSSIELLKGQSDRRKTLLLRGGDRNLLASLRQSHGMEED